MSAKNPGLCARNCEVCGQEDNLLRCSGCLCSYYCGQEHQVLDRPRHKKSCNMVKKARAQAAEEEQKLRDSPGDMFTPPNVFETGVGNFWSIHGTRAYMRARYNLVDVSLMIFGAVNGRADVVRTALDHLLDMMRLCRGDNQGLRDIIPALYIRLNRDQEAYDFVKWYATTGQDKHYNWGDPDLPFLDVKDADVFEELPESWTREGYIELSHAVSAMLIKLRILLDLQIVRDTQKDHNGTIPPEVISRMIGGLIGGIVEVRLEILGANVEQVENAIQQIRGQIKTLFNAIHKYNPSFWVGMLDEPAKAIAARPNLYSPQSPHETSLIVGYNYASWTETPGAIEKIKALRDSMKKKPNSDQW